MQRSKLKWCKLSTDRIIMSHDQRSKCNLEFIWRNLLSVCLGAFAERCALMNEKCNAANRVAMTNKHRRRHIDSVCVRSSFLSLYLYRGWNFRKQKVASRRKKEITLNRTPTRLTAIAFHISRTVKWHPLTWRRVSKFHSRPVFRSFHRMRAPFPF